MQWVVLRLSHEHMVIAEQVTVLVDIICAVLEDVLAAILFLVL